MIGYRSRHNLNTGVSGYPLHEQGTPGPRGMGNLASLHVIREGDWPKRELEGTAVQSKRTAWLHPWLIVTWEGHFGGLRNSTAQRRDKLGRDIGVGGGPTPCASLVAPDSGVERGRGCLRGLLVIIIDLLSSDFAVRALELPLGAVAAGCPCDQPSSALAAFGIHADGCKPLLTG